MGLLGKLFGKEQELPQLDPSSVAAKRLEKAKTELEAFVSKMHDRLELIPGDNAVYVFIGKPPGMFGMAWFHDGKEHNFKTLMKDKGLSQKRVQKMSASLGEAYEKCVEEPKFSATIAGKKVIVHPSEALLKDVMKIIHELE
jgi:hypothetical protein